MATDFEDEGGGLVLAFGETSGGVRVALLIGDDGSLRVVASASPTVTAASSGSGGENVNTTTAIAADFYLRAVTIHFNGAWANDVTVALDAKDGAAYDTVLATLVVGGETDAVWIPDSDLPFEDGDEIKVTSTNPGTVTFGLRIVTESA